MRLSLLNTFFGNGWRIALFAAILFLPFLGVVHLFDWDEINFAEAAREMIVTKNYLRVQINYQPFWEKPPLFIWMQAIAMLILGVGDYAARLPNAICGIVTLVVIYKIGNRIGNKPLGSIWSSLYACCWLPHFYFKSGIIDPWFNLLIFLSIYQFYLIGKAPSRRKHAMLSGTFLGLAVMTKGPVALLLAGLSVVIFGIWLGWKKVIFRKSLVWLIICFAVTVFLWFGIDALKNGWWFLREFLVYQIRLLQTEDAGHGGPWFYHPLVLLAGCFPASIFLLQYFSKSSSKSNSSGAFDKLMWVLLGLVVVIFSLVNTKIVHYSSLAYLPLTFLAAQKVRTFLDGEPWNKAVKISLLCMGILLSLIFILLPIAGKNILSILPLVKDPFAVENMKAQVSWSYVACLLGIAYLAVIIIVLRLAIRDAAQSIQVLIFGQLAVVVIAIMIYPAKIEAYSQRAAINFFKGFMGQEVYVEPLGFKSYAHLYYTKRTPGHSQAHDEQWLLNGNVDRPVYFIAKKHQAASYLHLPQLKVIGEKNGFVFFKRVLNTH